MSALVSAGFNILNRLGVSVALPVTVLAIAMALPACERRAAKPAPDVSRNLILVTIDTLRADRVGAAGGPAGITPAIDGVGRAGAVFLDATAHAPLTLPSHASILTGRYPVSHGIHDNTGFALAPDVPTLASVLRTAGYHTAAFVSSFVLRGSTGLSRGFDAYDDRFEGMGRSHLTFTSLERRGPEVGRTAAAWLAAAPEPFFLWVHFYDPHAPYDPPPAFAAKFPGKPYDGEVATSDFGLSIVLRALLPDRRARTLVIVTGDHGEGLGEHGEPEHGILLYDSTLHVPLVMAGPGVRAGTVDSRQARHVDILPTALALLGVRAPDRLDGVSLLARLSGSGPGRPGDAEVSYAESRFGALHFGWSPIRSLRDGTWKYIDGPDPELYHLTDDRGERTNQRESRRETASALSRALDAFARAGPGSPATTASRADAAERLRSLGYVTGRVALGDNADDGAADPKRQIVTYVEYVKAFNDGLGDLERGRPREAETTFRALARRFPAAFEPHQYLARSLAARGARAEALREYDAAIGLSPREAVVYFDAARVLGEIGRYDAAFEKIAAGLALEPSSFYGWLTRGLVSGAAGQTDAALNAYREAVRLNPGLAVAHLEIGRIAEARGDRAAARTEYQLAVDSDTDLQDARTALARVSR